MSTEAAEVRAASAESVAVEAALSQRPKKRALLLLSEGEDEGDVPPVVVSEAPPVIVSILPSSSLLSFRPSLSLFLPGILVLLSGGDRN